MISRHLRSPVARLVTGAAFGMFLSAASFTVALAQDAAITVVASFSILGDMAARVGGERIELDVLVGPNEDTHVYKPSPADTVRMVEADVVLVNGLGFEGFLDRLVKVSETKATVVVLGAQIEPLPAGEDKHAASESDGDNAEREDHEGNVNDPHAWHSLRHAQTYVASIAAAFCTADAQGCDVYRANAKAYSSELASLDADIRASLGSIPEDRRKFITSHDAFGYLADAYGLTILAPQGVSTESEASAADVARLIDQIRSDRAAAVFVENVADPRLVEQIGAETGLKIGGKLYGDALSEEGGPAATYVDMMRHNTQAIARALAGT